MITSSLCTVTCRSLFPVGRRYSVILADPPWEYSHHGNMPEKPYPSMSLEELKKLPVGGLSDRDCCLFLWATSPLLNQAICLMETWGFRFVSVYKVWLKLTSTGKKAFTPGYWSLGSTEMLLLGVRGHMQRYKKLFDVKQELEAERRAHSEKPDCVRDEIYDLLNVESRIELFSRHVANGWDAWGLEIDGYFHADKESISCPQGSQAVRVFFYVDDNDRVLLLHRVAESRSFGTQTNDAPRTTAPSLKGRTGTYDTPQKKAAAVERVPVSRGGTSVQGIARPGRKAFAKWWNGKTQKGERRKDVYTVDPDFLESAPDIADIVTA